jgi:peroxiredoxin
MKKGTFVILMLMIGFQLDAQSDKIAVDLAANNEIGNQIVDSPRKSLNILGDLKNLNEGSTVLLIDAIANKLIDSSKIIEGKFTFNKYLENTSFYSLVFTFNKKSIGLFIGNDVITINGDINNAEAIEIKGSLTQEIYATFLNTLIPKNLALNSLNSSYGLAKEASVKDSIVKQIKIIQNDFVNTAVELIKLNKQSPVASYFLLQLKEVPYIMEHFDEIYSMLDATSITPPIAEALEKLQFGKVGTILPNFSQKDQNGNLVSLASFRGKYVLVDFWASWCPPCRAENPNIVKAFNKFKTKNFTVLGVSLDQDKPKWLEAIKKDGLAWNHVSDLKFWNNAVAAQFGIQSIPASFLIDPTGKIIARDLRGADLDKFLATNLK